VPSVTIVLSLDERRLLLALVEHAANEHAEAVQEQDWDWLGDLFASSWETLMSARAALEGAANELAKGT
jgi:hypothetical protein